MTAHHIRATEWDRRYRPLPRRDTPRIELPFCDTATTYASASVITLVCVGALWSHASDAATLIPPSSTALPVPQIGRAHV